MRRCNSNCWQAKEKKENRIIANIDEKKKPRKKTPPNPIETERKKKLMSAEQVLGIEEIKNYVEKTKLFWGRFHKSISEPAFPPDRKDICAVIRLTAKRVLIGKEKDTVTREYDEILLVWKTEDGNIRHYTLTNDAFDRRRINIIHSIKIIDDEIVVNVLFVDKRDNHRHIDCIYKGSPWKKVSRTPLKTQTNPSPLLRN